MKELQRQWLQNWACRCGGLSTCALSSGSGLHACATELCDKFPSNIKTYVIQIYLIESLVLRFTPTATRCGEQSVKHSQIHLPHRVAAVYA